MLKIIKTKIINKLYNNFLIDYFGIYKTKKLIGQKYYWSTLKKDVEAYIKVYNNGLLSKTVKQKFYSYVQILSILIYY